VILQK